MRVAAFVNHAEHVASFRYRVSIPAAHADGVEYVNGWEATEFDVALFGKHLGAGTLADQWSVYEAIERCKSFGVPIVADICDDHFMTPLGEHYRRVIDCADAVVAATPKLAESVGAECGRDAVVIEDPYEWDEVAPRFDGGRNLFWYGHANNYPALEREVPSLDGYTVRCVSNLRHCIPYSTQAMADGFAWCDLVIIPTFKLRKWQSKGANRAVEAIRQGRYVVANPMPAYADLGIWQGNILEGIKWAQQNPSQVLKRIELAQKMVRQRFSPRLVAQKWASVFCSISGAATRSTPDGSTSIRAAVGSM